MQSNLHKISWLSLWGCGGEAWKNVHPPVAIMFFQINTDGTISGYGL